MWTVIILPWFISACERGAGSLSLSLSLAVCEMFIEKAARDLCCRSILTLQLFEFLPWVPGFWNNSPCIIYPSISSVHVCSFTVQKVCQGSVSMFVLCLQLMPLKCLFSLCPFCRDVWPSVRCDWHVGVWWKSCEGAWNVPGIQQSHLHCCRSSGTCVRSTSCHFVDVKGSHLRKPNNPLINTITDSIFHIYLVAGYLRCVLL